MTLVQYLETYLRSCSIAPPGGTVPRNRSFFPCHFRARFAVRGARFATIAKGANKDHISIPEVTTAWDVPSYPTVVPHITATSEIIFPFNMERQEHFSSLNLLPSDAL